MVKKMLVITSFITAPLDPFNKRLMFSYRSKKVLYLYVCLHFVAVHSLLLLKPVHRC